MLAAEPICAGPGRLHNADRIVDVAGRTAWSCEKDEPWIRTVLAAVGIASRGDDQQGRYSLDGGTTWHRYGKG